MTTEKTKLTVIWILRIIAAIILLQTLFFKFTGHPDSVYIFSTLHIEPWGRIGTGVVELIASILLLWPKYTIWGALAGAGVMTGAILSHLAILGIVVNNDGGSLFLLALVVFLSCVTLIYLERNKLYRNLPFLQRFKR